MKNDQQVNYLLQTKLIMAGEAIAVNTSVIIGIILVEKFVHAHALNNALIILGGLFGIGYSIWVNLGNVKRHKQIKELMKND